MTVSLPRRRFIQMAVAGLGCQVLSASGAPTESYEFTALELSDAIRKRTLSCVEVMQDHLTRIARLNDVFNAIVSLADAEHVLAQARRADDELAKGIYRGWLHGMPFAVKDLANAAGFVTSAGSPIFADNVAQQDSLHVARIKRGGAIIIGKTNVPEFGLGSQSYNTVFGATGCAYDASRTAGGSSGGAAAALALRMVPVADGSDFMGSLRNPAAFNNVIGFRPTPGVVPIGSDMREALAVNGPMGRTVRDTAQLLATMAGQHGDAPASVPGDPRRFSADLARDWRGTRIGWLGDFERYLPMEDGVLEVCEKALGGFRSIGCEVDAVRIDYSMSELWQTWLIYRHWMTRARGLALYENPKTAPLLKPEYVWEIEGGAGIDGDQVNRAIESRAAWYAAVQAVFGQVDFLVWPSAQVFPFPKDEHWPRSIAGRKMDTYHRWMETVVPGTLAGCPVINVPAGFSTNGLPMGLQIMAPRYADFHVLQIGHAYELATRWTRDFPPPALSGV